MAERPPRHVYRALLALAAICVLAVAGVPIGRGNAEEKPAAGSAEKKEGTPAAETGADAEKDEKGAAPAKTYKLGPPLNGYFDRSVLRNTRRIAEFRYRLNSLRTPLDLESTNIVQYQCVVEFGSESGMAEIAEKELRVREDLRGAIKDFTTAELLTTAGKIRLKETLIAALNRRLITARVRQVYLTDFVIMRTR